MNVRYIHLSVTRRFLRTNPTIKSNAENMNPLNISPSYYQVPSSWSSLDLSQGFPYTVAITAACVLCLTYRLLRLNSTFKRGYNLPPGLPSLPVIGNMLNLKGGEAAEQWWKISQAQGWPIMTFKFTNLRFAIVSSPAVVKEMLITKGSIFNSRDSQNFHARGLRESADGHSQTGALFTPHGSAWKITRKLMVAGQSQFMKVKGDKYIMDVLLPRLYEEIDAETSINARTRICKNMVVSTLMVFVFGPGAEKYANEIVPLNDKLFSTIDWNHAIELFVPFVGRQMSWLYYKLVQRRVISRQHALYERIIAERGVKYNQERQWSLCDMVEIAERDGEINHYQALGIYEEVFFGGQDTTVFPMEGLLKIFVQNPEILFKAQQEMDDVLGQSSQLKYEDLQRLPYFQGVIKEGLRLHRSIPMLIPHTAEEDATLGNFDVPKNMMVLVNLWGLAHDEALFPDPHVVKPERHLEGETNFTGNDCKYIVFGVGPRICPGQQLAIFMLYIIVGSLVQRYNIVTKDFKAQRESGTFYKEQALCLNLVKRGSSRR